MNDNRFTVRFNPRKDAAIINKFKELEELGRGAGSDWIRDALHRMLECDSGAAQATSHHNIIIQNPVAIPNHQPRTVLSPVFMEEAATVDKVLPGEMDEIEARFRMLNQD